MKRGDVGLRQNLDAALLERYADDEGENDRRLTSNTARSRSIRHQVSDRVSPNLPNDRCSRYRPIEGEHVYLDGIVVQWAGVTSSCRLCKRRGLSLMGARLIERRPHAYLVKGTDYATQSQ
jgi:hypothetical protein